MMQPTSNSRKSWKEVLNKDAPVILPGAYDALSAKLIESAGFDGYIIGGFPLVGSRYGLPDIGLVGLGEMAAGVKDIISASSLPILVDGDHGYGDVKNIVHTVHTYERLGVSALLLEDQVMPKRCGHTAGKDVIPCSEMVKKLRAASENRINSDFFILARTDSRGVHGLDESLRRAEKYIKAGADGIFIEAPKSYQELEIIGRTFDVPQMCNMLIGGQTPLLKSQELYEMGFSMIVHGTTLIKRVSKTLQDLLSDIKNDRMIEDLEQFSSLDDFIDIVGFNEWQKIENKYNK